ncbi:MAG: hypothetical protein DHS80DRAFT_29975 [Piptocephalis tieghemiana]|nr:MAG: hypothetical protein DHS80DRAFT_29975 [Piptocephalis tieghemiana]
MHSQEGTVATAEPPTPEEQLRSSWQFAAACQFIFSFGLDLGLTMDLTTDTLEAALSGDHSEMIVEVFVRLLRVCTANRFINSQTWVEYLKREFLRRDLDLMPFPDEMLYYQPPPSQTNRPSDKGVKKETMDHEASSATTNDQPMVNEHESSTTNQAISDPPKDHDSINTPIKEEEEGGDMDGKGKEKQEAEGQLPPVVPLRLKPEDFWKLSPPNRAICLYAACEWQLDDPERFRRMMKVDTDAEHWRVDPIGFDAQGGIYYLFDDNRLFVLRPPPPPSRKAPSSGKRKRKGSGRRKKISSRRTASSTTVGSPKEREEGGGEEEGEEEKSLDNSLSPQESWTLIARTLEDWEAIDSLLPPQSKDTDEQYLRQVLIEDISPKVLEDLRAQAKEKAMQEALLFRKRSSRLIRKEEEEREREARNQERRSMRVKAVRLQREEDDRHERALSRERRAQRREARLSRQAQGLPGGTEDLEDRGRGKRRSERSRRNGGNTLVYYGTQGRLEEEGEAWEFDCVCGKHGRNYDDGEEMVMCERCEVWQHVNCVRRLDEPFPPKAQPSVHEEENSELNGSHKKEGPEGSETKSNASPLQGKEGEVKSEEGMIPDWSSLPYYCPSCREIRQSRSGSAGGEGEEGDEAKMEEDQAYDPSQDNLINIDDDLTDDDMAHESHAMALRYREDPDEEIDVDVEADVDVDVNDDLSTPVPSTPVPVVSTPDVAQTSLVTPESETMVEGDVSSQKAYSSQRTPSVHR